MVGPPKITPFKSNDLKIRLNERDLLIWLNSLKRPCLFFDGASKSNPGNASVGGYIIDQVNLNSISFEWGLGIDTNNKAEAYGFLLGSQILNNKNYMNLVIIGESSILIKQMVKNLKLKKADIG